MSTADGSRPLRVAIDARIPDAVWGGVQQVALGLASGLRELRGDDEYLFLAYRGEGQWLAPHLGGRCRLIEVPRMLGTTRRRRIYETVKSAAPRIARVAERLASAGAVSPPVPRSDGTIESLQVDLVHFSTQQAFLTQVPSIYQPHDLLHLHRPAQFSPLHVRYRDKAYRMFCQQAAVVSVMTQWGRDDLCSRYELPVQKVAVVPWAPVAGLQRHPGSLVVPPATRPFLLYPAATWPHKNHARLLEAIAVLRDRGVRVDVICTGFQTEHFPALERRLADLRLTDQFQFTGFVDGKTLVRLFETARALIFPSDFEGWGLPVVEAFAFGLPVACSNATVLPEVVGDAAVTFDPTDPAAIADAVERVWKDERLRADLRERGLQRVKVLSWDRTARTFRALYRFVAGRDLPSEDRLLLAPPTLVR